MKIAFLNIYQKSVSRGSETFVFEMSRRLSNDNAVDIISGGKNLVPARWRFVWRTFLDPNGLSILWFTLKNLWRIWKEKYDVVIPLNGGWQPAFVRIVTWLYGGKMVISGQSGMGWDDKNNLWSFPDCFVALSSQAEKWAKKVNPFVKSVHIPNGVDFTRFSFRGQSYEAGLKKPVVLCVGAFTQQKRIDLAIKAVAKLKDATLLVVGGGGGLKDELMLLGRKLLGDRFELASVPFEEMPEIYRRADVFTLPSASSEAFGNVLVEAMASGMPVVATGDPIRREILGEAGTLVNPEDTEAYAQALREALGKDWGELPRKQAEKFDWDKIAEEYRNLFESLAK